MQMNVHVPKNIDMLDISNMDQTIDKTTTWRIGVSVNCGAMFLAKIGCMRLMTMRHGSKDMFAKYVVIM